MISINIPDEVKYIMEQLNMNGFEAFVVGGCVRDSIMNKVPKDWDITTNALPQDVKNIFRRCIDTGIKHGTVTVLIDKIGFEVTTYRIDGEYTDYRHPKNVEFTSDVIKDLQRRDFTINAMAYSENTGLVDVFEGIKDIERKVIRAVGVPIERFNEDALRILRAVRFAARFNYQIEQKTLDAMKSLSCNLEKISYERIREELVQLLMSENPDYFLILNGIGAIKAFFPEIEISKVPNFDRIKSSDNVYVRIALLVEVLNNDAEFLLKKLRFDNKTIKIVLSILDTKIVEELDYVSIKRLLNRYDIEIVRHILSYTDKYEINTHNMQKLNDIIYNNEPYSRKHLVVNGNDLYKIGIQNKDMSRVLEKLLDMVIVNKELNNKKTLINLIENGL